MVPQGKPGARYMHMLFHRTHAAHVCMYVGATVVYFFARGKFFYIGN